MFRSLDFLIVPLLLIFAILGAMCAVFDGGKSGCRKIACSAVGGVTGGLVGVLFLDGAWSHLAVRLWGPQVYGWTLVNLPWVWAVSSIGGAFFAARFICPTRGSRHFSGPPDTETSRPRPEETMDQGEKHP